MRDDGDIDGDEDDECFLLRSISALVPQWEGL